MTKRVWPVTDQDLLHGDLRELMRETGAKQIEKTDDVSVFAWGLTHVSGDLTPTYNVEMDEEAIVEPKLGRLCTTGAAACVVIVVRGYDKHDALLFHYVRHDSQYTATDDITDKKEILKDSVAHVLRWCRKRGLVEAVRDGGRLTMCVVGGQPSPERPNSNAQRDAERRAMSDYCGTQLGVLLKYYHADINEPGDGAYDDGTSLSVVSDTERVWIILDA